MKNTMITAKVKLVRYSDSVSESLSYKIKYKVGNELFYHKIQNFVAGNIFTSEEVYMDKLKYFTDDLNIKYEAFKMIKEHIEKENLYKKEKSKLSDIKQKISNFNEKKETFQYNVDLEKIFDKQHSL